MYTKKLANIIVTFVLVAAVYAMGHLLFTILTYPIVIASRSDLNMLPASIGHPVELVIPRLGVQAKVISVGQTATGAMDIPTIPADVAWYQLGPRPGEVGSAVISGHYGWKDNTPAVFDLLYTLTVGDEIYIVDSLGGQLTFRVRQILSLEDDADAAQVFGSNDGLAHLNLITCEGVWNTDRKSYSKRRVVFTDRII